MRRQGRLTLTSPASSGSATAWTAPWTTPTRPESGSRTARLPHRRDHPQPARQRPPARAGHPVPHRPRRGRRSSRPRRRGHPAGVRRPVGDMARLERQGCTLVDTTCGSVLNVWKNVRRYAQEGFTSVIHGKVHHEETRATASQATHLPGGHFLVVLDRARPRSSVTTSATAATASVSRALRGGRLAGFDPERIWSGSAARIRRRC